MAKTFAAFLHRSEEGTLSRALVETAILLAASRANPATVLHDAASTYKVDTEASRTIVRSCSFQEAARNCGSICCVRVWASLTFTVVTHRRLRSAS
ncbi:MAG TPA: hypothetical protein VHX11_02420 [Acidobacteriaceae bacterium]|nr:hypothetical protein [Acidobacteriaceae bacterium]